MLLKRAGGFENLLVSKVHDTPFDDERHLFLLNMSVILQCLRGLGFASIAPTKLLKLLVQKVQGTLHHFKSSLVLENVTKTVRVGGQSRCCHGEILKTSRHMGSRHMGFDQKI